MAGSIAVPGFGSKLANGGSAGTTYTNVAQVKKITFSAGQIKTDDITNLDSPSATLSGSPPPAGAVYQEILKVMVEAKDVTFDFVLNPADPTTQALLQNIQEAPSSSLNYWKLTTADGSTFIFQGYSNEFSFDVDYMKAIVGKGGIKVTGPVNAVWS